MGRFAIFLMMGLAVAGCSKLNLNSSKGQTFDGQSFKAKAKAERSDRQHFVASVKPVSNSLDGAIEAAEHQGIRHCIEYFGTSDIDWEVGPNTDPAALVVEDDTLTFMGTCRDAS